MCREKGEQRFLGAYQSPRDQNQSCKTPDGIRVRFEPEALLFYLLEGGITI